MCRLIEVKYFFKLSAVMLLVFKWSQAQVQVFSKFIWNMLCVCATQLEFWQQTDLGRQNSASFLKVRRERPFLTMVTRWSRATFKFYALIGQNLTDEFMRKVYAASWNLFTVTAEADRVLCELEMFLTVFFYWMYEMKFSYTIKSLLLFMASLSIGFLVEKYVACQSRKSDFG